MTTKPQPAPHLDADQLTAFAEGALSASERARCLQHLSDCAHCRKIAFLADATLPTREPTPSPVRRSGYAWWPVLSLGAAALTALIVTVALLHHPHQTVARPPAQVARESHTTAPPPIAEAPTAREAIPHPRAHSVLKPSPVEKSTPKPEPPASNARVVNGAVAMDAMAAPASPAAGSLPQSAPAGKSLHGTLSAMAEPSSQPTPNKAAGNSNATASLTMRGYNAATVLRAGTATISGAITDSAGATIPHAKITLDQTSGTAHRETLTDAAGRFTIGSLQPGKYHLEFSSPGFMTQVREIELGTSQLAQVDSQLTVGSSAQNVTVQAAASVATTESVSVQSVLASKEPVQTTVSNGTRTVALDTTGNLFLSKKPGKHWKGVHGPWKKFAVTGLSLTADRSFKVTTAQGSWLSSDGEHWHPAN